MTECLQFYIGGRWVDPHASAVIAVENPATEQPSGRVALGDAADVDAAVKAARAAFPTWSVSSREERITLLERVRAAYAARMPELGEAITAEMGAPRALAQGFQVGLGLGHLDAAIAALETFAFEEESGTTLIVREPIGVCALITPWNWPINQIAVKVLPALATGCTVVLKPSELAPFSAQIVAEILDAAGLPAGVFNLVFGDGPGVGAALAAHPDVDMVSFTGSTRAGVEVARTAAPSVKRVAQELGGKSPAVILDDAALADHVAAVVANMMTNSGQSCSAPSRMLVPAHRMDEAAAAARDAVAGLSVGDPTGDAALGPVVSGRQFDRIQALIETGMTEATLVAGGPGRPDGKTQGWFVRPTVFAHAGNDATIAREEIFGPVLVMIGYDDVDHAVALANDTEYGLAGFVLGNDTAVAQSVARRLRAGSISINGGFDFNAPFGGYKKSGNGREWGAFAFHEYLETKAIQGYHAPPTLSEQGKL